MIELSAFLTLGIVGVAASLLMKYLKDKYSTNGYLSIAIILGISIVLATVFSFIGDTAWAERFYNILANATIFFNFFMKDQS